MTIEIKRIKTAFYNALVLLAYKWVMRKPFTFKHRLTPSINLVKDRLGGKTGKAVQMHKDMYTAFAEGDLETLRKMCAEGLLASFGARLSHRPEGEKWTWTLQSYVGTPRIVSNTAGQLPLETGSGDRGSALRQVVVQIRSKQSLVKETVEDKSKRRRVGKGNSTDAAVEETGSPRVKEVTEYLVLQRRMWRGVEEPWIVWGFAEETTLEKLRTMDMARG